MMLDAHAVATFYQGRLGDTVRDVVRERLARFWPDMRGRRILGFGHARPYLPLWLEDAALCIDVVASLPSGGAWAAASGRDTGTGPGRTVLAEGSLPFQDLSIDRILLVHGLEAANDAKRLIRECWRVLRDDGSLLVVAPNRVGIWAHVEATPFGQGEPYTDGQVARLLASGMFRVERRDHALFLPPIDLGALARLSPVAERIGRRLAPRFAGLVLAEAVKDVYAALPVRPVGRRHVLQPARMALPVALETPPPPDAVRRGFATAAF